MTKREIVQRIAKEFGLPQLQAKQIVQQTFDSIVNILVANGRVELRNFGIFTVRWRSPRTARNPRTGEEDHGARKMHRHLQAGNGDGGTD